MKEWRIGLWAAALSVGLAACESPQQIEPESVDQRAANEWMVRQYNGDAARRATVRQRAIMPYHFAVGSAELNGIGRREVSILADHYQQHPGELRVLRGREDQPLHRLRIESVRAELAAAGVPEARVLIVSGLPGGDGAASDGVREALEQKSELSNSREAGLSTATQATQGRHN